MSKLVERTEIEAAMKRAARAVRSNDPFETNGRSGVDAADLARRVRDELRIATMNWATVEAFNASFEAFRDPLIERDAWQPALFAVRAIVRDVILTLFRVTDTGGKDLETIGALVYLLEGKTEDEIAAATGAARETVSEGLLFIRERIPAKWGAGQIPPANPELADLRSALRPVRDSVIAHAKTYSSLELRSSVPKTRTLLRVVSELSDAACMVCNVARDDLQARWDNSMNQSTCFWQVVSEGSVEKPA